MPKRVKEMSPLEISRLKLPGFYAVGVVPGLHLRIRSPDARAWVLRAVVGALRRDIGLGAFPAVTLFVAREKARQARELISSGIDPVEQSRAAHSALRASQAKAKTFEECAVAYIETHEASWKNAKHRAQWESTLRRYAFPVIGSMLVSHIEQAHILEILEPIWHEKTETAGRVRNRIELVLDMAKGRGYRSGDNPAAWKGNLNAQLARPEKISKEENHPSLPYAEIGAFVAALRSAPGFGARALEFAILTAARSGEVRGATWAEIDFQKRVWSVPAGRMKAGREHCVPLSDDVVKLLNSLPKIAGNSLVFPAPRGGVMSDMTITAVIRRMNAASGVQWIDPVRERRQAVPHGFRATFRTWAGEATAYPRDLLEHALSHRVGNAVENAYNHGAQFDKRARLMADWARFVNAAQSQSSVTPIRREA